jgi:hypothetical protein
VATVERLNASLADPEATWPAVLFLELPARGLVIGDLRSVGGLDEGAKQHLLLHVLPARIRRSKADRFAWVFPGWRSDVEPRQECLCVLAGEPDYTEALMVDVLREGGPPQLGQWSEPTSKVSGLLADPLGRALLAKPRSGKVSSAPGLRRPRRKRAPREALVTASGLRATRAAVQPLEPFCPDCFTFLGEPHKRGCDVERCTVCHGQRLMCDCFGHDSLAAAWSGEWPGLAACRELGWWAVRAPERGWQPCPPGTAGAREDLNRLTFFLQAGYDGLYEQVELPYVSDLDASGFEKDAIEGEWKTCPEL